MNIHNRALKFKYRSRLHTGIINARSHREHAAGKESMNRTKDNNDSAMTSDTRKLPVRLLRRIGSTTYEVAVHYSSTEKETMADIVRRILEREADNDV